MVRTIELVAQVKARNGLSSDAALARALGMTEKTVARWRTGRNWPDDQTAARLAQLAGLDAAAVVAWVHAERASNPGDRELWKTIAERLATPAAMALAVILALWTSGGPDGGASLALADAGSMCITLLTAYTLGTVARAALRTAARAALGRAGACRELSPAAV